MVERYSKNKNSLNSDGDIWKIAYSQSGAVVMSYLTWFGFTDDFVSGGHPRVPNWEFISLFDGNPDWSEYNGSLQSVDNAARYLCAYYIASRIANLELDKNIDIVVDYTDPGLKLAKQLIGSLLDEHPKYGQKLIEDTFYSFFIKTKNYLLIYWKLVDTLAHELVVKRKVLQEDAFLIIEPLLDEADKRKAGRRLRIEMMGMDHNE